MKNYYDNYINNLSKINYKEDNNDFISNDLTKLIKKFVKNIKLI